MVQAGETGGVLEDALIRVADQLQKDAALRRQIRSAMVYPTLVIVFAVGVMMALVAFLVPVFANVFKQFGGELPGADAGVGLPLAVVIGYWWAMFGGTAPVDRSLSSSGRKPPGVASSGITSVCTCR